VASALSAGTPGVSIVAPTHGDAMQLDDNHNNNNDYDNDVLSVDNDENNSESAGAPLEKEDTKLRKNCLVRSVVRTIDDYGFGAFVLLPDLSPKAPAAFETIELLAPMFFLSSSPVHDGGFINVDPPIYTQRLRWNLVAPFSKCNHNC
jgi:hypothetical protein